MVTLTRLLQPVWNFRLVIIFQILVLFLRGETMIGMQTAILSTYSSGQLGLGDKENRTKPHTVKDLSKVTIVNVAAGSKHSLCLTWHGEAWVCGKGSAGNEWKICYWFNCCSGQLGVRDLEDRRWPVQVESLFGKPVSLFCC